MANKNPLASWLLSQRNTFNPKFTELGWPKRFGLDLYDFSTEISLGDVKAEGRGVAETKELALEKSVAESLERLICLKFGISSVGVAVSGEVSAETHAKFEALERFYLEKHLQEKIAFPSMDSHQDSLVTLFKNKNPNITMSFYKMQTPAHLHGIVCCLKQDSIQSIGFSLSEDLIKSEGKAFTEAITNFAWLSSQKTLSDAEIPDSLWHLKKDFLLKIEALFAASKAEDNSVAMPDLQKQELDFTKIPELSDCPISPVRYLMSKKVFI